MRQTPVHDQHNEQVLALVPRDARRIVEVGCSSGALAREYKKINPNCHYTGVELVSAYAELARRYCDSVIETDIEVVTVEDLAGRLACDHWIFADVLEHLRDPWALLAKIREVIPDNGGIVACIPNIQHWSIQARLSCGDFRYEDIGLLDRTHLRWFTRNTITELFNNARFRIVDGGARIMEEPHREKVLPVIRAMAAAIGGNPDVAANDALPIQYVVRAVPA